MTDLPVRRGCCIDTRDPVGLAQAVALGIIWTASPEVIANACKLIATGDIPYPERPVLVRVGNGIEERPIPPVWASYIERLQAAARD